MTAQLARTRIGYLVLAGALGACSSSGGGATGTGGGTAGASGGAGLTGAGTGGGTGSGGSAGTNGTGGGSAGNTGQMVDTSGGMVSQSGVMLQVPADAVAAPTTITIAPTTNVPSGYALASDVYQFGPSGTQFSQPVTVTIPLTTVTPGVHVFWSNASGGFDDIGGTITGSSITATVTHFSVGFCALPSGSTGTGGAGTGGTGVAGNNGAGGAAGAPGSGGGAAAGQSGTGGSGSGGSCTGGGTGAAGSGAGTGGGTGAAGQSGASGSSGAAGSGSAGSSGSGAGGSATGAGGSASGAGGSGAAGSGATDAGLGADAAASLCKPFGLNLPGAKVIYAEAGAAPDGTSYAGGAIPAGSYYLNDVTQYGGGTYAGVRQAQYTVDTTAQTIVIGEFVPNAASRFLAMSYVVAGNMLYATVLCDSASGQSQYNFYFSYSGTTWTLTTVGSSDVLSLRTTFAP
jgi:hypothetical protein